MPRNAVEFATHFKTSPLGRANDADITSYEAEFVGKPHRASAYIESARAEYARGTREQRWVISSLKPNCARLMALPVRILPPSRCKLVRSCAVGYKSCGEICLLWLSIFCECPSWQLDYGFLIRLDSAYVIQSIIVGTVFLRMENTTTNFFSRGGVIFL